MATFNQTTNITDDRAKRCSRCEKYKILDDFIRPSKNNLKEFSSCNACAEKRKKKRSESVSELIDSSSLNVAEDNRDEMNIDAENEAVYDLIALEDVISNCFANMEENEPVRFSATFMFEDDLVSHSCDNQEIDEESKYHSLVRSFLPMIETGSRYYWEIRKIYLHKKNNQYTGEATAHLGCAQRDDRKYTRPDEHPSKRISEARPAIDRYPCGGSVTINIDINKCQATIDIQHLMTHEYPTYRENNIPQNAIAWISRNVNRGFRKIEFYKRLCEEKLINPKVHTYQQVYYWALKFAAQQYVTNVSNQLLSSRNFLEQQELVDQGYKIVFYLENDFVRALGFTTPFLHRIQPNNVSEIIIDSTYKTNQENFEVFAVINNCGGYGVPLAYLYVTTMTASSERLHDLSNNINTRVKVLNQFFSLLRADGVLPSFILLDKDAGEIVAAEEAWSWTANIQICLWHIEHAVERKLKEKRQKISQYTSQAAYDAKQQFAFIDQYWIPNGQVNDLCAEEDIQDILKMIKRHSVLHPLIPINEGTFLTSDDIYRRSVKEAYDYCKQKNLVYLWGYLWINWYKKNCWTLFARASYSKALPLARTTMLVESHWRVLKHNYKRNCNRPRLDRLTQILTKELIPDQIHNWEKYCGNRTFPSWWGAFKQDWKTALRKEVNTDTIYYTDIERWICSCPAFIDSTYLLCKHLVKRYTAETPNFFPQFVLTKRRHDYPLICFERENVPRIEPVNSPWNNLVDDSFDESENELENNDELSLRDRNEVIELRKAEVEEDKKTFKAFLEIVSDNVDNDPFYNTYKKLKRTLTSEAVACQEALRARRQQTTWNPPRRSKLAFWLR